MRAALDLFLRERRAPQRVRSCRGGDSHACGAPAARPAWARSGRCDPAPESGSSHQRTAPARARGGSRYRPTMSDLVEEQRVLRQLERLDAMRLQREGPPQARDRGLAHAGRFGHRPRAPVRRVAWRRLQRHRDCAVVRRRAQLSSSVCSSVVSSGGTSGRPNRIGVSSL